MTASMLIRRLAAGTLLLALAGTTAAHPGHDTSGLAAGLAHPFGPDHLLAIAAVGAWSATAFGGWRRLQGPLAFVAALIVGAAIGSGLATAGAALPALEAGLALSVVGMGLLLALGRRLPAAAGLGLVAAIGLLHGIAHGSELPAGAGVAPYAAGFVLATVALHAVGLGLGMRLDRARSWAQRALGALVGVAGLALLAGV